MNKIKKCNNCIFKSCYNANIILYFHRYESNCDVRFVWRGIKGGMKDFKVKHMYVF